MEIIAHRGASHDAPENTLAAVRLAWAQGADAVEVDVHLTRDGRLAVIHDSDTRRTAGRALGVASATLAELERLDVGAWKGRAFVGECLPSLPAVLALVPKGKRIFVEVKGGPEAAPAVQRDLAASGIGAEQVVVISFDLATCRAVKERRVAGEVCWLLERDSPERSLPRDALLARAWAAGVDGLDVESAWLDAAWVQAGRARGLRRFYVWTVDDPAAARRVRDAGVDGVTTNRPGWLRGKLAEGGA